MGEGFLTNVCGEGIRGKGEQQSLLFRGCEGAA